MPEEQFTELLEEAKAGDEAAWTEIYRSLAPAVLGYLRANGAGEPEDVLSEAFLQVARDVRKFEGGEKQFRSWVFTVAHHRLIDAGRHAARRPVEPVADVPEPDPVAAGAPDAATQALAKIGSEEIHSVLAVLSPDQRAVLLLRVIGDLTVPEVAKALGKRQGAIKQLQRRGLAAVQRELGRRGVPP